ncbi:hypothetical protein HUT19_39225 [Streptomyces sp. NA02950]|uniref:hypothetical protein n=1 Tax=Streptomyces sp. NA02950 TaxID=2742137 RepID=UPI00159032DA|nr:hypothetical protein [Streptomyces sp. NA02950]QKV96988.1 hypothetical protein HUT19_39225 [Streptomyces sp. NA02950]
MGGGIPGQFALTFDRLCTRPVGGRRPFANKELAQIVNKQGGDITEGYISLLRKGRRDNPTLQTVENLASALGVCPAVFVGGRVERRGEENPRSSFPAKLRRLFSAAHPPGRGPYTPEEVAKAICVEGRYGSISPSYIRELLNPPADTLPNPRFKHILGLVAHFGLPDDSSGPLGAYFLDDELAATVDAQLANYVALRDTGVIEFAMRMADQAPRLSPDLRRRAVETFIQALESGEPPGCFR